MFQFYNKYSTLRAQNAALRLENARLRRLLAAREAQLSKLKTNPQYKPRVRSSYYGSYYKKYYSKSITREKPLSTSEINATSIGKSIASQINDININFSELQEYRNEFKNDRKAVDAYVRDIYKDDYLNQRIQEYKNTFSNLKNDIGLGQLNQGIQDIVGFSDKIKETIINEIVESFLAFL